MILLHNTVKEYNMKIFTHKTKTMAYIWKAPAVRTKPVIDKQVLEQVSHFKYLGCDISYQESNDRDDKVTQFRHICDMIHKSLRNKTRKETRLKFYNTTDIPTSLYANETGVIMVRIKFNIRK